MLPRNQFPKNQEDVNNIIINLENSHNEDERKYIEPLRKFKPKLKRYPRGMQLRGRRIPRFENLDEYTDRIQGDIDYYNNDLDTRLKRMVSPWKIVFLEEKKEKKEKSLRKKKNK